MSVTLAVLGTVWRLARVAALSLVVLPATTKGQQPLTVRVGHFPNITHVQALVARNLERQGRGWFQQRLGPEAKIA